MIITSRRFRPDRLSSLVRWTDGSDPANGVLPANGAAIAGFTNKGRGSITTSQSTSGNQSVFSAAKYNGKGCVTVSSSNYYNVSGLTYSSGWTKILIATPSTLTNAYYEGSSNSVGAGPAFISGFSPSGTQLSYEYYNNTDRLTVSASATGLNIIAVTIQDGGAINVYINSTTPAATKATASNTINNLLAKFLFCSSAIVNPYAGDFCGLLDFNQILSASDFRSVLHYFGDYFGVTVT